MLNKEKIFKELFGEKAANVLNEALILVGGEDVELKDYLDLCAEKGESSSIFSFYSSNSNNNPIILEYDKDRFGKEFVLTSENSKFCYATRLKKTYIDFACETKENGIFHLEITFDDNGYVEYFNEETCTLGNFTYEDNLNKIKEEGFSPDKERHFKLHDRPLIDEEILRCIKECGNIIKKIENSKQRRR